MRQGYAVRKVMMHDICINIVLGCLVGMIVLVASLFIVSRAYIFQHELNVLKTERANEAWLLQQCEDDTFYHEMKHHSTLCDEVNVNSRDDIYLLAIKRVSQKTYLCGDSPCSEMLEDMFTWLLGRGFIVTAAFCAVCLAIPSLTMSCWNSFGRQVSAFRHRNCHNYYELLHVNEEHKKSV